MKAGEGLLKIRHMQAKNTSAVAGKCFHQSLSQQQGSVFTRACSRSKNELSVLARTKEMGRGERPKLIRILFFVMFQFLK